MKKIFVGYSLMARAGTNFPVPEFASDLKTEQGRANEIERKKAEYEASLVSMPYTGTFAQVTIMVPSMEKIVSFKAEGRGPGSDKPTVCQAVRAFLLKYFETAWSNNVVERGGNPEAIIVGFEPRRFLKILGIELSLPLPGNAPLPPGLWYGNSDHRDIEEAVLPKPECKLLGWQHVVQARRPHPELPEEERLKNEDVIVYDKLLAGWTGPGADPARDAKIAIEWAKQLNFRPKED